MAGNPASMLSGIACLEVLRQDGIYEELDRLGALLEDGIKQAAQTYDIPISINRLKGALSIYFTNEKVTNYEQAENTDGEMFARFFKLLLQEGILIAPSKYEAWFLTIAHTEQDVAETVAGVENAFKKMK
jgi:glutamate-1-semialdehyde 2,1-aminomutase